LDWILGANNSPWSKFHSNSKFQEESIINSVELKPRNFPEFSFQSPSESEKVSMEKQLRYQRWHCGVAAKHTESPWEKSNFEQPFQMIVVKAGLGMIFLLQTPIVNYYSPGLPIYRTRKT
jgi:hypothetical protein